MHWKDLVALFHDLSANEKFAAFVRELDARFGAQHRTVFVPNDPYSTAYNEGARSVMVFLNRLAKEALDERDNDDAAGQSVEPADW